MPVGFRCPIIGSLHTGIKGSPWGLKPFHYPKSPTENYLPSEFSCHSYLTTKNSYHCWCHADMNSLTLVDVMLTDWQDFHETIVQIKSKSCTEWSIYDTLCSLSYKYIKISELDHYIYHIYWLYPNVSHQNNYHMPSQMYLLPTY